jgi:hypothetical protein
MASDWHEIFFCSIQTLHELFPRFLDDLETFQSIVTKSDEIGTFHGAFFNVSTVYSAVDTGYAPPYTRTREIAKSN